MNTVRDAVALCGVNNVAMWGGNTQAQRIATDLFSNDFAAMRDMDYDDLTDDFKSYSNLPVAQGRIRLSPGTKRNIRALIQWSKDQFRRGLDPFLVPFPIATVSVLLRQEKTHLKFVKKAKTIAESAKPGLLTTDTKWHDWRPIFANFLRSIPGRDGVPLAYIIRTQDAPDPTPRPDFLDEYVAMAELAGESFVSDANEVHTYIIKFIAGNANAESKLQPYLDQANGRLDFQTLVSHFEGTGVHSYDITRADRILDSLHYAGEKKPHMWWAQFEIELNFAFNAYDKKEGRQVHSNEMRLRTLVRKVKADFLTGVKSSIEVALSAVPLTMTYEQALKTFRDVVTTKYPPEITAPRSTRRIQQNDRRGGRFERGGRGGGRGHGRGGRGRGGRGGRGGSKRSHPNQYPVRLTNGKILDCHSSYHFTPDEWKMIPADAQRRIQLERAQYKRQRADRAIASISNAGPYSYQNYGGNHSVYPGSHMVGSVNPTTNIPPPPPSIVQVQGTAQYPSLTPCTLNTQCTSTPTYG